MSVSTLLERKVKKKVVKGKIYYKMEIFKGYVNKNFNSRC